MGTDDDKPASQRPSIECKALEVTVDLEKDLESGRESPVESHIEDAEEAADPNIVFWDSPDDKNNPQNWSLAKKGTNIFILSVLTFLTPLASSMFAPGVPQLMKEFNVDKSVLSLEIIPLFIDLLLAVIMLIQLTVMYWRDSSFQSTYWDGHWALWYVGANDGIVATD